MKSALFSSILFVLTSIAALAQTPSLTIKGDLAIRYNTRSQTDSDGKPRKGATDVYTMSVNVANSALFRGNITHRPYLNSMIGAQTGLISYEMECDVVNPANPAQTRNIGKLYGTAPIDANNIYRFSDGSVKVSIFGIGSAKGFESKFSGLALGKPPVASGFKKLQQDTLKLVNGKGKAIAVAKYDKMSFQNHIIAAGPVQIYPEATVNGDLIYDYGRTAWHFNGVTISYVVDGKRFQDSLTGSIRWVESPSRKTTGEGEYIFDIKVNEPPASEAAAFSTATDESAFFAVDNTTPSLTGTMKYKDSLAGGGTVVNSVVKIDLVGNQLNKQQVMHLTKLLLLSSVVPLNAE